MDLSKYINVRPVIMEGFPDAHNVFFKVGVQEFCVTPYGAETRNEAELVVEMLKTALTRMLNETSPNCDSPEKADG